MRKSGSNIFQTLRISVDALQFEERMAFFDIACFFIGKNVRTALRFWEGCGWTADSNLRALKQKSLVKVDPTEATFVMHDQIRDMGRYIVAEEKEELPEKRTHVWDDNDAREILEKRNVSKKGSSSVRGLSLAKDMRWRPGLMLNAVAFRGLSELRMLLLSNVDLDGDLKSMPKELRWLEWKHCKLDYLPPEFDLRHLTVLDLSDNYNLKRLWDQETAIDEKVPKGLMELNLRYCSRLQWLPQMNVYLKKLQRLDLSYCDDLRRIPDCIGSLQELEILNLSSCNRIENLPETLTGLGSLTELNLSNCLSLRCLPEDIGRLTKLTEINLRGTCLETLPPSFGKLEALKILDLDNCHRLAKLPSSIGELRSLQYLSMDNSGLRKLPEQVSKLIRLVELRLRNCKLKRLPQQIGQLQRLRTLSLYGNRKLSNLPATMSELCSLETLEMGKCFLLTNEAMPQELGRLHSLKILSLDNTMLRQVPTGFLEFAQLVELVMNNCKDLREARFFPSTLRILDLSNCHSLEVVSGLESLRRLETLSLNKCVKLEKLKGLESFEVLTLLNIRGCVKLRSAPGLFALKFLKELDITGTGLVPTMDCIERLPSIQTVTVNGWLDMPQCFKNCNYVQPDEIEWPDDPSRSTCELARVQIPGKPCIALLFCFVVDGVRYWVYNDIVMVKASVQRSGSEIREEILIQKRSIIRTETNLCILRFPHPLLSCLQAEDKLKVNAYFYGSSQDSSVMQVSVLVVHGERELEGYLRTISRDLRWGALRRRMFASLELGGGVKLRELAALDPAGNTEVTILKAAPLKDERLDLVWRPKHNFTFGNKRVIMLGNLDPLLSESLQNSTFGNTGVISPCWCLVPFVSRCCKFRELLPCRKVATGKV